MLTRITRIIKRYITRCERIPQRGLSGGRKPRKSSNTWGGKTTPVILINYADRTMAVA